MAIKLEESTASQYRTAEPVWIGPDGKAYGDDDKPDGSIQLAGVDGVITAEDAAKYGLGGAKAVKATPEDKAVASSPEDKVMKSPAKK